MHRHTKSHVTHKVTMHRHTKSHVTHKVTMHRHTKSDVTHKVTMYGHTKPNLGMSHWMSRMCVYVIIRTLASAVCHNGWNTGFDLGLQVEHKPST